MQYAPVLIPTLNRYDHFKRCLDSLEKCTGADKTEVYVSLDYPPSDKYVDGWKKIDIYLKDKEQNNGFKALHVTRRETNYFTTGKSVFTGILEEATKNIDYYITSEDDNEFSPCFLDFMNKALDKYRDNPKVYTVCGFNQPEYEVKGKDVIFIYDNSAWGFGRWINRESPSPEYIKKALHSRKKVLKLWKTFPALLNELLVMLEKGRFYGDASLCTMCICEDMYQLRPSFSLVRNTGDDGSGQHTGKSGKFSNQKISDKEIFELIETPAIRSKELDKSVYMNMMSSKPLGRLKMHLSILLKLLKYSTHNEKSN